MRYLGFKEQNPKFSLSAPAAPNWRSSALEERLREIERSYESRILSKLRSVVFYHKRQLE